MNDIVNSMISQHASKQDYMLRKCINEILGRDVTEDDYKDIELVSISGEPYIKYVFYKGKKSAEFKTDISITPNFDSFENNNIKCNLTITYKLL